MLCTPDGMNENLGKAVSGHLRFFSRYTHNRAMASFQAGAKGAVLGLWADDDPMPPQEWRRK